MKTLKIYSLILLVALSVSLPPALAQRKPAHSKPVGMAATATARGGDTITAAQLRTSTVTHGTESGAVATRTCNVVPSGNSSLTATIKWSRVGSAQCQKSSGSAVR